VIGCDANGRAGDIKEVAGHSELKTDAQLDQLSSELELRQRVASYQGALLDAEGEMIALFKLAVLETRKSDDVQAIADVWKAFAELYSRRLAKAEETFRRYGQGLAELGTDESTASILAQLNHLAQKLIALRDRAQALYELHA
jgi:hypothetical protein